MVFPCMYWLLLFAMALARISGAPVTCHIAASPIAEGTRTVVTCVLNRNLRDLKRYTLFVSYIPNSTSDPAQILICHHHKGTLCSVAEGYELEYLNGTNLRIGTHSTELNSRYDVYIRSPFKSPQSKGNTTTCTAPTVQKGTEAYVLCEFNKDVSNLKTFTVAVEHYPDGDGTPVAVLMCIRLEQLQCFTSQGYAFDYQISHKLHLKIPRASDQHAGRYACDVLSPEIQVAEDTDFCTLKIGDISDADSSTCKNTLWHVGLGAAAGAFILGSLSGFIVGYCFFSKRKKYKQNTSAEHTQEESRITEPKSPSELPLVESPTRVVSDSFNFDRDTNN